MGAQLTCGLWSSSTTGRCSSSGLHAFLSDRIRDVGVDQTAVFSVQRYTRRAVINLRAEPSLLYDQIMVRSGRARDFETHLQKLNSPCHGGGPGCVAYVLVLPHCCQVNRRYLRNMTRLGATFGKEEDVLAEEYPFLVRTRRAFEGAW
jgi:hypothetical protein